MHIGVKILSISSVPLLFVLKWFWGDFTVTVHVNPAVVLVGQAVTLSCHLIGQIPANIQVHWYKLERNKNTTLYFYNSTEKETELGLAEDQHRIKGRYRNGVARVKLFPVQVEDNGQYVCAVTSDGVYQEAIIQVTVPGFFDVEAEHDIITAIIGENAILPCRLITKLLPPSMELQWRKVGPGKDKTIYLYLYDESSPLVNSYPQDDKCSMGYLSPNGVNSREWLTKKYENKAEVFKGKEFGKGNISLKLNNIQVEDEGKYICSVSTNSFHREIIIEVLVKEELEEQMGDVEKTIKELQKQMRDMEKRIRDMEKRRKEIQVQIEQLQQIGDLEKRMREMEKTIKQLQEEKGDLEKRIIALICLLLPSGVIVISFLGKCIQEPQEEKEELQEQMVELQKQMEELQEEKGDMEKRIKELQEEKDKMKKELEWRWARNNSDDITLHGVTAHPNLSISGDEKSFKHEAQPQQVPQNPERFDSSVCVLGTEGFSSGKHYWEVEVVSSNDWDLGVARKSIQRKGKLSLSPKKGFWVLGLSGKDYWAKTDPWTQVNVQKKPKKIGVYFSYQEGQVTFFNVTDMSVLFTFNDCSFSGEVYPFFKNSQKKTTMRICST